MSQKASCKMCSNTPKKSNFSKIDSLPKTFAILLEEMAGRKFSKSDMLEMIICNKCIDFLKNMENSLGPKSNKITGAGKERVFKLMEKKRIPTGAAIEIVLAEQRAKEMLVAAGLKKLDKDGNLLPVQAAPNAAAGRGKALPSLLDLAAIPPKPNRMSGAQRKKVGILVAGGMDPVAARELVYAASLANSGNLNVNPNEIAQSLQVQANGEDQTKNPRRRRNRRRGDRQPQSTDQNSNGQEIKQQDDGKAKAAPVQRVAPVKSDANQQQKTGSNPKGPVQNVAPTGATKKTVDSSGAQTARQNNNSGGGRRGAGAPNSDRRVGPIVPPRRNERPAPYSNNNNNNRRQQNQSPWQNQNQSRNQQDNGMQNFNQQLHSLQQQTQQQSQNTSCTVGIVPIKYPNDMLDNLKLDALKEAITNEILKIPPGGPLIRFLGTSSQVGWLKVICADQLSYNWLAQLVSRWERAGIRLAEGCDLPEAAILSFYLEGDFRSPNEILNIIDKQNDSLNANAWRLMNRESDGIGQRITVCVNEQCFQALQQCNFMVFLGLGVVELKPGNMNVQNDSFNQNSGSSQNYNDSNTGYNNGGNFSNSNSGGNNRQSGGGGGGGGGSSGNRSMDRGRGYNNNGNYNQNQNKKNQREGGYQNRQRVW